MKNIKAFTLAESLISMALIGIIFTAVGTFISRYFILGNQMFVEMESYTTQPVISESLLSDGFFNMPFISEVNITKENIWELFLKMQKSYPQNIVYDEKKNIYMSDTLGHRIIKLEKKELSNTIHSFEDILDVSIIAGTSIAGFSGNGGRSDLARIRFPSALMYNKNEEGDVLYFIDFGNSAIRKVDISVIPNYIINVFLGDVRSDKVSFQDKGENFVFSLESHIIREEEFF